MHRNTRIDSNNTGRYLNRKCIIVILIFIAAFGIRLLHIDRPPLDYNLVRQYQDAHIARNYYFENNETIPEWRKEIARLNSERMGYVLEPRIMENLAVIGYKLTGGEHLWIARTFSSLFWVAGGIFLYLIARKLFSYQASLLTIAYYLFLPFGISSSRSFQPDPLMVMMIMISLFYVVKYHDKPTGGNLITASVLTAIAIFVKPYSLFMIFCSYLALSISRSGIIKSILNKNFLIFATISSLPVVLYYAWGLLSDVGYLREHAQNSFVPHIMVRPYFWKNWYTIIGNVIGFIPFLVAVFGFLTVRKGLPRVLLASLWLSYLIFGVAATHHIHTHTYYHMQFIPVVALSLGSAADYARDLIARKGYVRLLIAAGGIFLISLISSVSTSQIQCENFFDDKSQLKSLRTILGVNTEFRKFVFEDFKDEVRISQEIGDIVGHSTNIIFLTRDFGRSLAYHGELSGYPWPTSGSLLERKERGLWIPGKNEIYNDHYLLIRTHDKYIKYSPDYFVVTYFKEFEEQTDLSDFLRTNFPIIAQNKEYMIFDLRKMSQLKQ